MKPSHEVAFASYQYRPAAVAVRPRFFDSPRINDLANAVQSFSLFAGLSFSDCKAIVWVAHQRQFSRGQKIHIQGDSVRQLLLLLSGSAKTIQVDENGSPVILRVAGRGEVLGALGLPIMGSHCSTAQALGQSVVLLWETNVYHALVERFPGLRLNMIAILGKRLAQMEERFRELSIERVPARLSRQIVRLSNQVGHRENGTVEIRISREELAQLVGTTLFTVSRTLSKWKRQGILRLGREVVAVRNLRALEEAGMA